MTGIPPPPAAPPSTPRHGPSTAAPGAADDAGLAAHAQWLRERAGTLGFDALTIGAADPGRHADHLRAWLAAGHHADMDWMVRHADLRADPQRLVPGAVRVISVRAGYLAADDRPLAVLADPSRGYIARYALGRDYHRALRQRLARLAAELDERAGGRHRAFTDSAPVLEKGLAELSGLGWIGKNTLLLTRDGGSMHVLGEILTTLPLPVDPPLERGHCGSCTACIDTCPTGAIVAPGVLDARRCIAWMTIEYRGTIAPEFRRAIGNRIFGCDDCQLYCPWNRAAPPARLPDFAPRHGLEGASLDELWAWSEADWQARTEGSALRRIDWPTWRRNLAIALGNAPGDAARLQRLRAATDHDPVTREHIGWAIGEQQRKLDGRAVPG